MDFESVFGRRAPVVVEIGSGMGDATADVFARGLSAVSGVPMDVSLRMSMGNLLPGTGMLLRSNTDRSRDVMEVAGVLIASITECLGTKALVADAVRAITGKTHYDSIAQDTIAMAVNDLITVGATPLSLWLSGGAVALFGKEVWVLVPHERTWLK